MIISFNGEHGSGKSTIAKELAEKLGFERVYMGQAFRDLAEKRGLTVLELAELSKTDASIDKTIDDHVIELGKNNEDFVIESRTAWHFIPKSVKIYLKVDERVGAERMFKHLQIENNRANEDRDIKSVDDLIESSRKRREKDNIRYKKYYGIDMEDLSNYDFVLDTTNLSIEQVCGKVLEFVKQKKTDAEFA